jgi:hypothetical protein
MISRAQFWILLVVLNGAVWLVLFHKRTGAKARSAESSVGVTNVAVAAAPRPVAPIVVRTNAFEWRQLESEDYRTYINRLRSIGCPEETIRDIVIADLEKLMAPQIQQAEGRREAPKYWEPRARERTVDTLEKLGQKQDIDFKKREIVRELLGIDLAAERSRVKGESDFYEQRLGFLEPEKQMRVRMAMEKANRDEQLLREKSWLESDELTKDDQQQLREIQQQKEQEVSQVLSPDEYQQYQLWFSGSAYKVRDAFQVLEPNESDFLALYNIQKEFDDRWDGVDPGMLSAEEKYQYQQAQNKYDQAIRDRLGPDRYEQFLQTREPDFQQMQDTIAQFGLKPDIASQVYGFKKALLDERARVTASGLLDSPQKQEVLKALSEETEQAVVEAMGPKAYRYFVRGGAGKWISQ